MTPTDMMGVRERRDDWGLTLALTHEDVPQEVDGDRLVAGEVRLAVHGQEVEALLLRVVLGAELLRGDGDLSRSARIY